MFDKLFGKPRFISYEDSFARTRTSMLGGLRNAMVHRIEQGESFLIVTHFADTFVEMQDKLASWSIEYQINSSHSNPFALSEKILTNKAPVTLSLSGLLRNEQAAADAFERDKKIGIIVVERHPDGVSDDELEQFCRALPCYVELGYFLSFEDAVVVELIHGSALKILDLFGMGENELITSNMISRRLKNMLKHNSRFYQTNHAADSAQQWMQLNKKAV